MNPFLIPSVFLNVSVAYFTPTDYILIAILVFFILISTFVSSSEVAFFSLDHNDMDEVKSSTSLTNVHLLESLANSDRLLASILIAYNVANVGVIALSLYFFNKVPFFISSGMGYFLQFLSITIIIVLFIEILPKLFASHNPLKVVRRNIKGIILIDAVVSPFSSFLVRFTNIISQSSVHRKHEISMDELSKALELTSDEISHEHEKDMLEGIIRFRDKNVDDILISRADMVTLNMNTSFKQVIDFIIDAGYSRIPIYEESEDQIKGILYVKDLLPHIGKPDTFKWQTLIRAAYFVPGTKRIDELLEEFRTNKNHMAIVVDEYGGTTGIITMEDVLEEVVGDISDEYDEEVPLYTLLPDGSYIFDGKTPLVDFLRLVDIPEKNFDDILEDIDTLAGLMLELKGTFPKQKESFNYKDYTFQAEEMNKRRIVKIRYIPPVEEST
ncbi:MAG: gliding motility-associated protein GldE [Dysgonamonadaceae bacterium]|nr:gliding motility-associated protein GldE [Dysgonamonadaceae bacterium]MDD3356635.1 gliding motility-associated protein GldE [Dysgonamonadaceae bacterium]MDD3727497.1 gliding motility-associated protein GldE [Dysgonamonadaceae bacterium]MDD4246372.1 gliding motility-associated protein GldE [Dysgonamonadaceae bacterium]MDD4604694.1 gliding motility-associated protein GldE [Dysgonamonadaceae bacterium]